jgi:hypothetical protein
MIKRTTGEEGSDGDDGTDRGREGWMDGGWLTRQRRCSASDPKSDTNGSAEKGALLIHSIA